MEEHIKLHRAPAPGEKTSEDSEGTRADGEDPVPARKPSDPTATTRSGLCDLCGVNTTNLYQHKRTVHPDANTFRCTCCHLVFTDEKEYNEHMSREARAGGQKQYVCPEEGCGEIFTKLGSWRCHIRDNHSESRSACNKCNKVTLPTCLKTWTMDRTVTGGLRTSSELLKDFGAIGQIFALFFQEWRC
jgi:uncharacterized C2H2 Zn-finger protein